MSACEKGPASKVPLFLLLKEMEKKKKKKTAGKPKYFLTTAREGT